MDLAAIWDAALGDAGLDRGDVDLRESDIPLPDDVCSRYLVDIDGRRVEVHRRNSPELLVVALVRHELEHVLQVAACPDLYELHALAQDVAAYSEPPQVGSTVYNTIPMEVDANAAGFRFASSLYGDEAVAALSTAMPAHPVLRAGNVTATERDLYDRMIDWFVERVTLCHQYVRGSHQPLLLESFGLDDLFARALDDHAAGAGAEWRQRIVATNRS
jgi:hypothetical protein